MKKITNTNYLTLGKLFFAKKLKEIKGGVGDSPTSRMPLRLLPTNPKKKITIKKLKKIILSCIKILNRKKK